MPYTMEDFRRDYAREHLKDLTPEEILEAVPVEKNAPPTMNAAMAVTVRVFRTSCPPRITGASFQATSG